MLIYSIKKIDLYFSPYSLYQLKMAKLFIKADIHSYIKDIDDGSIDLIYTSPPYGITEAKWDKPLDWKNLFPEMWRVLKPNGIIVLYASMPFTYELLKYETPKYHYTWVKNTKTNFFKAKLQPLRNTEEIFIYYKQNGTYNPQMDGDIFIPKRYNKQKDTQEHFGRRNNIEKSFTSKTEGHVGKYPITTRNWKVRKDGSGITRGDDQMDYFIKTYSNKGDLVLDMTCCNSYTGNRCEKLNRKFIGVDINL